MSISKSTRNGEQYYHYDDSESEDKTLEMDTEDLFNILVVHAFDFEPYSLACKVILVCHDIYVLTDWTKNSLSRILRSDNFEELS